MRRARWFRLLSAILAFWVPLSVGEPSALRLCSAHDGSMSAATEGHGAATHHDHAAAASTAESGSTGHHAQSPESGHQCSCISCCSISVAAVSIPDAPVAAIIVAAHETSGFSATAPMRARPGPEFARPYTTGPPRV